MGQWSKLRSRVARQTSKFLHKFQKEEPHKYKEVTNMELQMSLFSIAMGEPYEWDDDIESRNKMIAKVHHAMTCLTKREMQVVNLRFFQGYTPSQVAKELNLHQDTIRQTLNRALNKLKDKLASV